MRSNLNFLFALLVVILIVTVALASRGCGGGRVPAFIDPMLSVDEADARSRDSGKPVFVLVGADWCEPCHSFKAGAMRNSKVVQFLKDNTEPVYMDGTRSNDTEVQGTLTRLGVQNFPACVIRVRGQNMDRMEGDVPASEVLKWLQATVKPAPKH
jgi:thiol:disulfide interchange protein